MVAQHGMHRGGVERIRDNVVITGASGFLGGALARALAASSVPFTAVARSQASGVLRVSSYEETPPGDVLVHAAEMSNRRRAAAAGDTYELAAAATLHELLRKGYRRVLYVSSASLYGDRNLRPSRPEDPVQATDTYTRVKHAAERAVLAAGGAVVRMANLYGPGMSTENVVSRVLEQVPGTGPVIVEDIRPVRDFLWIEDAARALAVIALSDKSGIFNLGSGRATSIEDLARAALSVNGQELRTIESRSSAAAPSYLVLDMAATVSAFGVQATTSLEDGLRQMRSTRQ